MSRRPNIRWFPSIHFVIFDTPMLPGLSKLRPGAHLNERRQFLNKKFSNFKSTSALQPRQNPGFFLTTTRTKRKWIFCQVSLSLCLSLSPVLQGMRTHTQRQRLFKAIVPFHLLQLEWIKKSFNFNFHWFPNFFTFGAACFLFDDKKSENFFPADFQILSAQQIIQRLETENERETIFFKHFLRQKDFMYSRRHCWLIYRKCLYIAVSQYTWERDVMREWQSCERDKVLVSGRWQTWVR